MAYLEERDVQTDTSSSRGARKVAMRCTWVAHAVPRGCQSQGPPLTTHAETRPAPVPGPHAAKSEQATARMWQRMRTDVAAELVNSGDYENVDAALQDRGL